MEENREHPNDRGNDIGDGFDHEIERGRRSKDSREPRKHEERKPKMPKLIVPREIGRAERGLDAQAGSEREEEHGKLTQAEKNLPCRVYGKAAEGYKADKSEEKAKGASGDVKLGRICVSVTVFFLVCGILILAAVIGSGMESTSDVDDSDGQNRANVSNKSTEPLSENGDTSSVKALSKAEIYSKNIDGVVSVSTETANGSGVGSGFFVTEDGYVATAAHVVENAKRVWVILASGKREEARIVAANEFSDVALLKISGAGYKALEFGSSEGLEVGDTVTAIGTPASLEYAGSLSSGEVSYNNRTLKVYDSGGTPIKKMKVIQTNAQVNPGNSGCPIFNAQGEVVGMISMKLGRDYEGLGFALPADGVKRIIEAMMSGDEIDYDVLEGVAIPMARIGISGREYVNGDVVGIEIVGFKSDKEGAVKVLSLGDVITNVEGKDISTVSELSQIMGKYRPGDRVSVTVYRRGQYLTFGVTLY